MPQVQKAAKAHDSVSNHARNPVDHQMVDFADRVSRRVEDFRAFDTLARDKVELGVSGRHGQAPVG
jgi:hypothetical protein